MRKLILAASHLALTLAAVAPATAQDGPKSIAEAVASAERPAEARAMDEGRKPAEVLAWSGIAAGMEVADIMPGLGYWTEMMADIVGPEGSVAALQPDAFHNEEEPTALWNAILARSPEASRVRYPFDAFAYTPDSLDLALINNSYHELYWQSEQYSIPFTDPDGFVAGLYAAMRPGGIVVVIDHVATGDPRATVDTTHRIDPAVVRADFERGGFVLVDTSDMLANPEDDHKGVSYLPPIAGHTDRFMFKFAKPVTD